MLKGCLIIISIFYITALHYNRTNCPVLTTTPFFPAITGILQTLTWPWLAMDNMIVLNDGGEAMTIGTTQDTAQSPIPTPSLKLAPLYDSETSLSPALPPTRSLLNSCIIVLTMSAAIGINVRSFTYGFYWRGCWPSRSSLRTQRLCPFLFRRCKKRWNWNQYSFNGWWRRTLSAQ